MPSFETSIVVAAKPDKIWRVMSDVVGWPAWTPTVTRVEALDHPHLEVGRRYGVEQPGLRPAIWTVCSLAQYQEFVWQTNSPGIVVVASHRIAPWSEDASLVTLSISVDGILAWPVWPFIAGMISSNVRLEAQSLAVKCLG